MKVKRDASRVGISKPHSRMDSPLASSDGAAGSNLGGSENPTRRGGGGRSGASSASPHVTFAGSSHLRAVTDPDMTRAWSVEALSPTPGMVTNGRPLGKRRLLRKPTSMEGSWQVLAAQTLKIASINGLGEVDKLENDLEDELRYENRSPAKTAIGRLRRAGQHKIHSKVVLLIVVILNIIDCLLVISELVLDFLHVLFDREEVREMVYEFIDKMSKLHHMIGWEKKYEGGPHGSDEEYISYHFLEYVLNAFVTFKPNVTSKSLQRRSEECVHFLNHTAETSNQSLWSYVNSTASHLGADWSGMSSVAYGACFGPFLATSDNSSAHSGYGDSHADPHHGDDHGSSGHGHDDHYASSGFKLSHHGYTGHSLLDIAHKLHYASVAILSVLVLLLFIKIFCSGKRFFRSRMQVFDGVVILISFTLDIVFIEGLAVLRLEEFIIIIAFLLPWRILRVLNSLIAAVLDQQRLNLKIMYTQKKKISRTLSETTTKLEVMQRHIEVLQALCTSRGLSVVNGEIVGTRTPKTPKTPKTNKSSGKDHSSSSSSKHGSSTTGLAGMMALGKLAFQAADALAPISNGYASTPANNNNNNNSSNTNGGSGGDGGDNNTGGGKTPPLANGHTQPLSASDDMINRGEHPSHEMGTELTPAGHVKAESDSDLFTVEQELQHQKQQQQQQQHQQGDSAATDLSVLTNTDKDVEAGADGSARDGMSETTVSVESEDNGGEARPSFFTLNDTSSPAASSPPSLPRQPSSSAAAPEIIASPSTLEADLDSVSLKIHEDDEPTVAFSANSRSLEPEPTPSSQSPSPSPTTTATAENTSAQNGQENINESDVVSKL